MARVTAVLLLLIAAPAVYAVDYTVGDSSGWSLGVNYDSWAAGKKFTVGDNLVFTYGSQHAVNQVNQNDYDNCNAGNALASFNNGNSRVSLDKPGTLYYICPTAGHCSGGMKLQISVAAAATPGGTPSTTPATPTTPSGSNSPPSSGTPSKSNGAAPRFGGVDAFMVSVASLMVGTLLGLMG